MVFQQLRRVDHPTKFPSQHKYLGLTMNYYHQAYRGCDQSRIPISSLEYLSFLTSGRRSLPSNTAYLAKGPYFLHQDCSHKARIIEQSKYLKLHSVQK